ncbi:MAG: J domain-containing protein [Myxococcales bacterium]|nr:J domain-containing protein [Myxococcales bacterium]
MRPWSKRELLAFLDRVMPALEGLDHFELLDGPPNADDKTIQGAFHNMAGGLHPDRHRNIVTPSQHERLIVVYARIAEAYRVLRSPEHREKYLRDEAKRRGKDAPATRAPQDPAAALALLSPKAQQLYRRAIAAGRTGDKASAMLNMRMALAKHPHSGFLKDVLRKLR